MRHLRSVGAIIGVGMLGVLTCADSGAAARSTAPVSHEIKMRSISFGPRELTVGVGDTVVWHNVDIVRHNAIRPEVFDTGELQPGGKYSWVPSDTGTYRYQCTIHQRMRGRLTVATKP